MHETTDNKRNMQRTSCNMQHAKDNRQQTTVVTMIRHGADNMQHTTRNGHQCDRGKAATPTHRGAKVNVCLPRGRRSRGRVPAHTCFPRSHSTLEHSMSWHAATAMPTAALRTYAHVGRVARAARTRCTSASGPARDALFAPAALVASRIVRASESGQCRLEHSYSVRTGRAATSCSRIQSRANPGNGMLRKRGSQQTARRHTS
jgi:hypothetical protein